MLATLALLLTSSSPAFADDTLQPQVAVSVQGTRTLNDTWGIRGSGHFSWAPGPKDDTSLFFLYAGPKAQITPWLSIALQLGTVVNWKGTGDAMPLASVWGSIGLSSHLNLFVVADIYPDFADKNVTYYGFYSIDYNGLRLVSVGAHAEQINESVNVGPHVGIPLGEHVWVQVNYHRGIHDWSNALRINLNVSL